jgi:small conductance mechanosensitive channel
MFIKFLQTTEENQEGLKIFTWEEIWNSIVSWCATSGIKFVVSLIALIIVFVIINTTSKAIRNRLRKRGRDETISNAIFSVYRKVLKFVAIIAFFSVIGFDMTGVASIIASATVAIGLALQGSLSNIAGWVLIIFTRPFRLGDYIKAQGEEGTVEEINLFYTHLKTPDNKQVVIPNGNLSSDVIVNYSIKDIRRVELLYSIDYDSDCSKAIEVIRKVVEKHPLALKDPACFIRVKDYADSSIDIVCRVWTKNEDYWTLHFDLLEQVKVAFDENNIEVPYNKLDVNIKKEN